MIGNIITVIILIAGAYLACRLFKMIIAWVRINTLLWKNGKKRMMAKRVLKAIIAIAVIVGAIFLIEYFAMLGVAYLVLMGESSNKGDVIYCYIN